MISSRVFAIGLTVAWAATGIGAGPAGAQDTGPIEQRKALMKRNGAGAKLGGQMLKGEVPFDAAKAKMIFTDMNDVANKFGGLFPANSKTGGKTTASPAIWTKPDQVKAALVKFQTDTKAAAAANPQTLDAFKQQFGTVTKNCASCHEDFRVKDS